MWLPQNSKMYNTYVRFSNKHNGIDNNVGNSLELNKIDGLARK